MGAVAYFEVGAEIKKKKKKRAGLGCDETAPQRRASLTIKNKLNTEHKQTRENTQQPHKSRGIYNNNNTKITIYFKYCH